MVFTRTEAKAAFTHVLDQVLGRGDGTPLKSALLAEDIDDVFTLVSLDEAAINSLRYDDNGASKALRLSDKMLLKCFLQYVVVKNNEGELLTDGWTKITQTDFDEFRINPIHIAKNTGTPTPTPAPTTPKGTTALSFSPADIFRRGIKRDPTLFPILKDEKFNDSWHCSFVNQARAQDVSEVLDATYIPKTSSDMDLFTEKQKYVYALVAYSGRNFGEIPVFA